MTPVGGNKPTIRQSGFAGKRSALKRHAFQQTICHRQTAKITSVLCMAQMHNYLIM
jgi:hypothetical protein